MYKYIMLFIIFIRQVDDNPTNGPDKSTKKIIVDESTNLEGKYMSWIVNFWAHLC